MSKVAVASFLLPPFSHPRSGAWSGLDRVRALAKMSDQSDFRETHEASGVDSSRSSENSQVAGTNAHLDWPCASNQSISITAIVYAVSNTVLNSGDPQRWVEHLPVERPSSNGRTRIATIVACAVYPPGELFEHH